MTRKALALALLVLVPGGDREEGLRLYRQGKYAEAAAAFRRAAAAEPSAELSYNLALSLWRAGDLQGARAALEEMAVLAETLDPVRHDGLAGALHYDEARALREQAHAAADPTGAQKMPLLRQALEQAQKAVEDLARAGSEPGAPPALARNLERALRLVDELNQEIEELEQQQQQQQQENQQQQDQQQSEQKQDQQQDQQRQQQDQQQEQQQEQQQQSEQKQDQQQQQDQQQDSRQDAPGEQVAEQNLSPEERQRLLERLQQLEELLEKIKAQQRRRRAAVERDW